VRKVGGRGVARSWLKWGRTCSAIPWARARRRSGSGAFGPRPSSWPRITRSRLDRSQLEDPELRPGVLGSDFEGLTDVGALEDVEPGDVDGLLGDRPVSDSRLARSCPNRPALRERAEHVPLEAYTPGVHLF